MNPANLRHREEPSVAEWHSGTRRKGSGGRGGDEPSDRAAVVVVAATLFSASLGHAKKSPTVRHDPVDSVPSPLNGREFISAFSDTENSVERACSVSENGASIRPASSRQPLRSSLWLTRLLSAFYLQRRPRRWSSCEHRVLSLPPARSDAAAAAAVRSVCSSASVCACLLFSLRLHERSCCDSPATGLAFLVR